MKSKSTRQTSVGFSIQRGVNISHWLSQTDISCGPAHVSEEDIIRIKNLGFDHVRIPIDEHELWNDDGLIMGKSFLGLKKCLDWCLRNKLKAVVVLKKLRNYNSFDQSCDTSIIWEDILVQESFFKMWRNLSGFLQDYPKQMLAYELLNEPNAPNDGEWNSFIEIAVNSIRNMEPERVIIIGSNRRQSERSIPSIKLPPNDKNIIVSFKYFKPIGLTHYKANWTSMKAYNGPVNYPGQIVTKEVLRSIIDLGDENALEVIQREKLLEEFTAENIEQDLQKAVSFAEENNISLYCNQFGCLDTVPSELRKQYYMDIIAAFKKLNISYSYWDYKGDFGVMKIKNNTLIPDRDILVSL